MINQSLRIALLASFLALVGCNGPKGSPGGSVKSFFSSVTSRDWEAMSEIISDDSLKRIGTRPRAAASFARDFDGWKEVDVTITEETIDADETHATVSFDCVSMQMENYKARKYDCSDIYRLVKQDDGKWHLHMPGATRVKPMQ